MREVIAAPVEREASCCLECFEPVNETQPRCAHCGLALRAGRYTIEALFQSF